MWLCEGTEQIVVYYHENSFHWTFFAKQLVVFIFKTESSQHFYATSELVLLRWVCCWLNKLQIRLTCQHYVTENKIKDDRLHLIKTKIKTKGYLGCFCYIQREEMLKLQTFWPQKSECWNDLACNRKTCKMIIPEFLYKLHVSPRAWMGSLLIMVFPINPNMHNRLIKVILTVSLAPHLEMVPRHCTTATTAPVASKDGSNAEDEFPYGDQ